ncbi:hypothetical protein SEVIR_3G062801v4 [Setaria viridis]
MHHADRAELFLFCSFFHLFQAIHRSIPLYIAAAELPWAVGSVDPRLFFFPRQQPRPDKASRLRGHEASHSKPMIVLDLNLQLYYITAVVLYLFRRHNTLISFLSDPCMDDVKRTWTRTRNACISTTSLCSET